MDVATRRLVGPFMPGSVDYSPAAAFSPNGQVIAVTGQNSVSFWDVARGHTIGAPIAVSAVWLAFSPNGKILATAGPDGTTNLWDAASHQELGGELTVDATAGGLTFSPDSTMLATGDGSSVSFWDVAASRQIGAVIDAADPIVFSPNGRFLAASNDGLGLLSVATHREIGAPFVADVAGNAAEVAFSPDGKIFATGGGYPQLWDVATHHMLDGPIPRAYVGASALAFSPDGRDLAFAGGGETGCGIWTPTALSDTR
jgi:WD40 repeat protein